MDKLPCLHRAWLVRQLFLVCLVLSGAAISYAQLVIPDVKISREDLQDFRERGELSDEDSQLYAMTQTGNWTERHEAVRELLGHPSVPDELRRQVTFQYVSQLKDLVLVKQICEDWLSTHPDDPAEIELRFRVMETLSGCDEDTKLKADERLRQIKNIMSPIAKRYPADDLTAIQARGGYAAAVRVVGYQVAEQWASSPEAQQLSSEERGNRMNRMVLESTEDAERELQALKATMIRMCARIPKPKPVDPSDPAAREVPEYNLLAGIEHELKQTEGLKLSVLAQIDAHGEL